MTGRSILSRALLSAKTVDEVVTILMDEGIGSAFGQPCGYIAGPMLFTGLGIPCEIYLSMMTSSNGNIFRVTGHLWPVTRSFDVFFNLRLNKRLSKQS